MQIEATSGPELRDLREAARLTQAEVAEAMGIADRAYLSVIESKAVVRKVTADRYRNAVHALARTDAARTA